MKKIFFTSDLHFRHANIVKYCSRPFSDVQEMDQELIARWNSVVDHGDVVYVVGDFSLSSEERDIEYMLHLLKGEKHLIVGNHDSDESKTSPIWKSVNDLLKININGQIIVLCHYSMIVWDRSHYGSWMLHGHSHGSLREQDKLSFDVGVDVWNYTPVLFEQVRNKMMFKQKNILVVEKLDKKQIVERNAKNNERFFGNFPCRIVQGLK